MPAFASAQQIFSPYENSRFERTYLTLRQPSLQIAQNQTLRSTVANLATATQLTVWLDRRIDGEQIVSIAADAKRHLDVLESLCQHCNGEIAWLENIIYLAPSGWASRIETAHWQLAIAKGNDPWKKIAPAIQWQHSMEVSELANRLLKPLPFKIQGIEGLPFDRWAAAEMASSTTAAQWSCFLAGFAKTVARQSNQQWQLSPLPAPERLQHTYRDLTRSHRPTTLQAWRKKWPDATIEKLNSSAYTITCPVAGHRELRTMELDHRPLPPPKVSPLEQGPYELTLKDTTIGNALPQLAKQLGFALEPWPLSADVMARQIDVSVKKVSLDEMLSAIGTSARLSLQRHAKIIKIQVEPEK